MHRNNGKKDLEKCVQKQKINCFRLSHPKKMLKKKWGKKENQENQWKKMLTGTRVFLRKQPSKWLASVCVVTVWFKQLINKQRSVYHNFSRCLTKLVHISKYCNKYSFKNLGTWKPQNLGRTSTDWKSHCCSVQILPLKMYYLGTK